MKLFIVALSFLASSSAFAYVAGTYECGSTTIALTDSGISGLPVVEITGFNNSTLKGLGQIVTTTNEAKETVETIKYNLGARAMQIVFVDGRTSCVKTN